jgi:hypothetical protein
MNSRAGRGISLWFAAALLLVLRACGNHNNNFFHFDDGHTITDNPWVRDLRNIPRFFSDGERFGTLAANRTYRPLVSAFAADRILAWPWPRSALVSHPDHLLVSDSDRASGGRKALHSLVSLLVQRGAIFTPGRSRKTPPTRTPDGSIAPFALLPTPDYSPEALPGGTDCLVTVPWRAAVTVHREGCGPRSARYRAAWAGRW